MARDNLGFFFFWGGGGGGGFETVFGNSSSYPLFSRRCLKMARDNRNYDAKLESVTARVWCRGRIDRKRNSTINLTTDSGACY